MHWLCLKLGSGILILNSYVPEKCYVGQCWIGIDEWALEKINTNLIKGSDNCCRNARGNKFIYKAKETTWDTHEKIVKIKLPKRDKAITSGLQINCDVRCEYTFSTPRLVLAALNFAAFDPGRDKEEMMMTFPVISPRHGWLKIYLPLSTFGESMNHQ